MQFIDVGALAAFTLLHASVVGYFVVRQKGTARPRHYLVPILGALVTLWVIAEASTLAQTVGAAWTLAGIGVFAMRRRRG